MVIKTGRFGKFLACPGYPECKNTKPLVVETSATCPKCGGKVIQKKSKRGYVFFGCENYPECNFMTWDKPTDEKCPKCGKSLFKRKGVFWSALTKLADSRKRHNVNPALIIQKNERTEQKSGGHRRRSCRV